jgi:hypothetical protein
MDQALAKGAGLSVRDAKIRHGHPTPRESRSRPILSEFPTTPGEQVCPKVGAQSRKSRLVEPGRALHSARNIAISEF